jgi:pimeloyl-ACP methyl ester carboxylesterase
MGMAMKTRVPKILVSLLSLLSQNANAGDSARAPFDVAREAFLAAKQALAPTISNERHLPSILVHEQATPYVAVVTHGLYDSPFAQSALTKDLFQNGVNTVSPLLPGHWSKSHEEIDRASYAKYVEVQNHAVATAKNLGDRIIFAGHSTGGLLAFRSALETKNAAAIVLAAPAFGLTRRTEILTYWGTLLGVSGNWWFGGSPDGLAIPYISPYAGKAVSRLIANSKQIWGWPQGPVSEKENLERYRELFRKVDMPVVLITSSHDDTIRSDIAELLIQESRGPKLDLRTTLGHADSGRFLQQRPSKEADLPKWKESQRLEKATLEFLEKELKLKPEQK